VDVHEGIGGTDGYDVLRSNGHLRVKHDVTFEIGDEWQIQPSHNCIRRAPAGRSVSDYFGVEVASFYGLDGGRTTGSARGLLSCEINWSARHSAPARESRLDLARSGLSLRLADGISAAQRANDHAAAADQPTLAEERVTLAGVSAMAAVAGQTQIHTSKLRRCPSLGRPMRTRARS